MMFISWTVFDSNISYSRWKWPTFIPDVPLKTLCQLISGCSYGLKLGILYPQIRVDSKFFWLASAGRVLNPHTFKYVTPRLPTCRPRSIRSILSYEYVMIVSAAADARDVAIAWGLMKQRCESPPLWLLLLLLMMMMTIGSLLILSSLDNVHAYYSSNRRFLP